MDGATARDQLVGSLKGKKIAYVPVSMQFDLTALWDRQFKSLFKMMGADYVAADANSDIDAQVRMIDSFINDGVDMLLIQNSDVGVLSEQVKRAQSKGIYVISVNVQGTHSSDAFVGADYRAMARDLATRMVKDCKTAGKSKVAVVTGWGTDSNSLEADKGWLPVFKDAGLEVVSKQQSNFDPTKANQIATAVLQQNRDLCGFAVIFDVTALGVVQAVEAAGASEKVGVYTIDASAAWCDALEQGRGTAGVGFNGAGIAVAAAYAAQELLLVDAPAGSRRVMGYVPHEVLDRTNARDVPGACYGS